jgi:3-isopropylmalate/(R)-2-methylmalate dehydratase small subunit
MTMQDAKRTIIEGTGIPVRGNDIDTDRIIPARFLKSVVFEGLGEHAFEDDRLQLAAAGKQHTFDDPRYKDATILFVNKNFGCGSSREHAPQSIMRWGKGIRAIVGESFAEIFYGNCLTLGIPCPTVDEASIMKLMDAVEANPNARARVDLLNKEITVGAVTVSFTMPDSVRNQFLEGKWDSTLELLSHKDKIAETASKLPYFGL